MTSSTRRPDSGIRYPSLKMAMNPRRNCPARRTAIDGAGAPDDNDYALLFAAHALDNEPCRHERRRSKCLLHGADSPKSAQADSQLHQSESEPKLHAETHDALCIAISLAIAKLLRSAFPSLMRRAVGPPFCLLALRNTQTSPLCLSHAGRVRPPGRAPARRRAKARDAGIDRPLASQGRGRHPSLQSPAGSSSQASP